MDAAPAPGPEPRGPADAAPAAPAAPADGTGPHAGGRPLEGVRVLDLSRVLAGPFLTMLLGDLGADVVKVERPGSGDDTRSWGPPFAGEGDHRESTYFLAVNRNKRSVEVDLADPAERGLVERLVRWADVLVENFRPGVMDRLDLGDRRLSELNPRLVRLSISGFGDAGPERDRVGYDQILQAEGGVMGMTGDPDGTPVRVGVPVADLAAGLFGTIGILAALLERVRSGAGQRVTTSLLAGQIGLHVYQGTRYLVAGEVPGPSGPYHPTVVPYGTFTAADGPIVIAVGNDELWRRFAGAVGLDAGDPRFVTNAARVANREVLHELIGDALGTRNVATWIERFSSAAVPAGEVRTLDRVYAAEQVRAQGLVWSVPHPELGPLELPGNPIAFDGTTPPARRPPPRLGQHNDEVRHELHEGLADDAEEVPGDTGGRAPRA